MKTNNELVQCLSNENQNRSNCINVMHRGKKCVLKIS